MRSICAARRLLADVSPARCWRRVAEVAYTARAPQIGGVAEVADEREHAAGRAFTVREYLFELRRLVLALSEVGLAPLGVAAGQILLRIHARTGVDPEFLERRVKQVTG